MSCMLAGLQFVDKPHLQLCISLFKRLRMVGHIASNHDLYACLHGTWAVTEVATSSDTGAQRSIAAPAAARNSCHALGWADKKEPSLRLMATACKALHQAYDFVWRLPLLHTGLTTPVQRMHA